MHLYQSNINLKIDIPYLLLLSYVLYLYNLLKSFRMSDSEYICRTRAVDIDPRVIEYPVVDRFLKREI